tara:strand:- start:34 stop:867 length:834 start_codon:yes stop_codon:yes gene_type:complete
MAGLFETYLPIASAGYGLYDQYDSLNDRLKATQTTLNATEDTINDNTAFTPYGVTSSLGGANSIGQGMEYDLMPQMQRVQDNMFSQGQQQLKASTANPLDRQNELYAAMNQAQDPERQRELARMNQQLRNSGRSGMTSQMYGGTPEQLAYSKAVQEQQSANWLGAGSAAETQLQNQYTRGIGMMDQGYKPNAELMGYGDQVIQQNNLNDARGTTRAGMLSDLAVGGLATNVNIENLKGRALSDFLTGTSQQQTALGGLIDSSTGKLWEAAVDWWDKL